MFWVVVVRDFWELIISYEMMEFYIFSSMLLITYPLSLFSGCNHGIQSMVNLMYLLFFTSNMKDKEKTVSLGISVVVQID